MREVLTPAGRLALAAGAALVVAGCGGSEQAANVGDANALDANLLLQQPGNDASALESAVNAAEPAVGDTGNQGTEATDMGNGSGGDTGGNSAGRNATGT